MQLPRLGMATTRAWLEQRLGIGLQCQQFFQLLAQPRVVVAGRVEKGPSLRGLLEPACGIKEVFQRRVHLKGSSAQAAIARLQAPLWGAIRVRFEFVFIDSLLCVGMGQKPTWRTSIRKKLYELGP